MIVNDPELGKFDLLNPDEETIQSVEELQNAELPKSEKKDFKPVLEAHKKMVKKLGYESTVEFSRLIEEGNMKKVKSYVAGLPDSDPMKKEFLKLIKYA